MNFQLTGILCLVLNGNVLSKNLRIIGGKEADIRDFPYMVSLRYDINKKFFCAGTIISSRHIITAGHCIDGLLQSKLTVCMGTSNLDDSKCDYDVRQVNFHPKYKWIEDNGSRVKNDIAILTIDPCIKFNEFQNKIDLPTVDIESGDIATISGWGWTTYPDGDIYSNLNTQSTMILSNNECKPIFPIPLDDYQVCTLAGEGIGSCFGDSGGPLVINGKLVGVSSLIKPCATGTPDIFTRVFFYLDFIKTSIESSMITLSCYPVFSHRRNLRHYSIQKIYKK